MRRHSDLQLALRFTTDTTPDSFLPPELLMLIDRAALNELCRGGERVPRHVIGLVEGMSREKVRRIEREAMQKLRAAGGSSFFGKYKIQDTEGIPERHETREVRNARRRRNERAARRR
jgi:hypothetical protein